MDTIDNDDIAKMAAKLAPLRALNGGPDASRIANAYKLETANQAITYSRVEEGLKKLIVRMEAVRGMSDVLRSDLTRELPKDDVAGPSPADDDKAPIFEVLARLTLQLSHEIETTERHLALALAALK